VQWPPDSHEHTRHLTPPADDDDQIARHFTKDPFYVLEAPRTATRRELESATMRLLDALSQGLAGAARYLTPLGERSRDAASVQDAAHVLRDHESRIVHEIWAGLPVRAQAIAPPPGPAPWRGGERALGWRRR